MAAPGSGTLQLARRYVEIDRPQAALDVLAGAGDDELSGAEYWSLRAEALLQLDRHADAAEAAARGLEQDPEDVGLLDALAVARLGLDDLAGAEAALDRALELSPDNPALLAHRALTLARDRRFAAAQTAIREAMRITPEWPPVLRVRAQVAVLADDPSAERCVDDLLERDPEDRIGHALRGNLASRRKEYVAAARAFDEAARLDPGDAQLATVAREARVAAHPVLAPVRALWRFGRWRSYFVYLTILFVVAGAGFRSARLVVAGAWVALVILSRVGPRVIRWRHRRRYGGF